MQAKWKITALTVGLLLIFAAPVLADVQINETNFPDAEFRKIVTGFDTDGDNSLNDGEIAKITEIDCEKNASLSDLTGIGYLTGLKELSCWSCPVTKLDLSSNSALEYLDCCETKLTSLDVTHNPKLQQLWAFGNSFSYLNISKCPLLLKAVQNGIYNNNKNDGSACSFADEATSAYLVVDKKVELELEGGKKQAAGSADPAGSSSSSGSSASSGSSSASSGSSGSSSGSSGSSSGSSGSTETSSDSVEVGKTISFSDKVTLPGTKMMEGYFLPSSSDRTIATATAARTGNIIYSNGITYYFSVWVKGESPGTVTIKLYNDDKTIELWKKVVTVTGDPPQTEDTQEDPGQGGETAGEGQTGAGQTDGSKTEDTNTGTSAQEDPKEDSTEETTSQGSKYSYSKYGRIPGPKNPTATGSSGGSTKDETENETEKATEKTSDKETGKASEKETEKAAGGTAQAGTSQKGTSSSAKKVSRVTVGNGVYKLSGKTASLIKPKKKTITSLSVPASVKANGKTYNVTAVSANACKGLKKLKTVSIGKNVKKIGKNAFYGCKNLKTIVIKTTGLKAAAVGSGAFKGINAKAAIKVPKKKLTAYKNLLKKKGIGKKVKITK